MQVVLRPQADGRRKPLYMIGEWKYTWDIGTRTLGKINICHIFFLSLELVRIVVFTQFTSRQVYLAGFVL